MTKPEPWDPTPPSSTLMDRQAWLSEGNDYLMDEAEEASNRDRDLSTPSWMKPAKMEPEEPDETQLDQ